MSSEQSDELQLARNKRERRLNGPHANKVRIEGGVEWFQFAVSFRHEERTYEFHIWALNQQDADERVASIKGTARQNGQVLATFTQP